MKIVNKKRFIKSISITIGLIFLIIVLFINTCFSHTEIHLRKVYISDGDNLWSIAKYEKKNNPYFQNKDIRDIVDEIKYINNLQTSNLNVGDELSLPTV